MKILVIDDTQKHLDAAVETLKGHNVTLCASYDEALNLLEEQQDNTIFQRLYKEYTEACVTDAYSKAHTKSTLPYWDAVLCDLLMPAGNDAQKEKKALGQEMPAGWSLALVAAMRGAKYVAVASDVNHHDHPGSAMLDRLDDCRGHIFNIDGAKVLMTNRIDFVHPAEEICLECTMYLKNYCGNGCCKAIGGKDWGKILNRLIK